MKKLHNTIKKINNIELSTVAFSAIGVMALTNSFPFMGAALLMTLPLSLSGFLVKHSFWKNKSYYSINSGMGHYLKAVTHQMKSYIEDSDSLVEKKYKVLFLSIWCRKYKVNLEVSGAMKFANYLEDLSNELIQNKITNNYVDRCFFYKSDKDARVELLKEDFENNKEQFEIAKKVLKDFEEEGFLGKSFSDQYSGLFYYMAELTEHKLTDFDVKEIEQINKNKKEKRHLSYMLDSLHDIETFKLIYMNNFKKHDEILQDYLSYQNKDNEVIKKLIEAVKLNDKLQSSLEKEKNITSSIIRSKI